MSEKMDGAHEDPTVAPWSSGQAPLRLAIADALFQLRIDLTALADDPRHPLDRDTLRHLVRFVSVTHRTVAATGAMSISDSVVDRLLAALCSQLDREPEVIRRTANASCARLGKLRRSLSVS